MNSDKLFSPALEDLDADLDATLDAALADMTEAQLEFAGRLGLEQLKMKIGARPGIAKLRITLAEPHEEGPSTDAE